MIPGIIIAFPDIEDAKKIRSILIRKGFEVFAVSSTAAGTLAKLSDLECGIVICGYKLKDQYYRDVLEYLPERFELLLIASSRVINEAPNRIKTVELPVKVTNLVTVIEELQDKILKKYKRKNKKPAKRSEEEQNLINNAKLVLIEKNHITEDEAYRYIQKCSMDSGTNMVETAQMILMLQGGM